MNYKKMVQILNLYSRTDAQADTITVYIDGKYFPAKIRWHKNDVVDQFVLEVD